MIKFLVIRICIFKFVFDEISNKYNSLRATLIKIRVTKETICLGWIIYSQTYYSCGKRNWDLEWIWLSIHTGFSY